MKRLLAITIGVCLLSAGLAFAQCAPIVVGQGIPNTYMLHGTTGEKRCTTNSASNRFGICTTDTDCGGTAGACMTLPWVTADGQIMPFSTGTHVQLSAGTTVAGLLGRIAMKPMS